MNRVDIPFSDLSVRAHHLWAKQWLVLTCGDFRRAEFNSMAVGWGSFGTMWSKPFALVLVRPVRYTYTFMERYDSFTLCAFGDTHRSAVQLLGSKSGRDGNKIQDSGLTAVAASKVAAPAFEEAELIVECRKIYWDDMAPKHFVDPTIDSNYPKKDYHRIYFGEIMAIAGVRSFCTQQH
jgi:flavin reductase (DIM6/NTAB) family NADH-FMN oxidoreductase RutF